ncbi:MAG TPA: hypothetical protein DGQ22_02705 [Rhodobiaceae bacterium]|nr:hypothetical protein [Rhodobiaceae bacterium]|tara:strand:+ start:1318 stop:2238 length:921 start_codon:yes stop_codon:yes gene_type:complete
MNKTRQAILLAILAAFGFSIQDTSVKALTSSASIWQLMFIRSLIVVSILGLWAFSSGVVHQIKPKTWFWPIIRAICMSLAYTFFYASLPFVALSEASSCFFTAPIFVCVFASLFLGERIGLWRISAVTLGFFGALLIIQPGLVSFKPILILPVLAGAFYAIGVIITRGLCREEPSFSLTVTHNLFYAGLGLFAVTFIPLLNLDTEFSQKNSFLFQGWIEMTVIAIVLISVTAVTHIISMTASIFAYQNAETTIVAPVEYTYLIFAAFIDYLFWSFTPSMSHIMGATIILGSGITITWREWIAQKSA